jgi:peptidoglycan/xylan/chitin deacetylase (PgdA/CDA1 family)
MKNIFLIIFILLGLGVHSQTGYLKNSDLIKVLYQDSSYMQKRESIAKTYAHAKPGHWGEFIKGVDTDIITKRKIIALTFDACGGKNGNGYDKELIEFLRTEKIPATLFFTGKWIDHNLELFQELAKDTLFEIENHGLNHQPCSVDGESAYGIHGTPDAAKAYDEIEANEIKIERITGRRPLFYRSATAFIDEACAKIAGQLKVIVISFDVLSGDAVPNTSVNTIVNNVLKNIRSGAIVIMHMNHPERNTFEALRIIVPDLRKEGYTFTHLEDYPEKGR